VIDGINTPYMLLGEADIWWSDFKARWFFATGKVVPHWRR
jgi:hypothetical protein